MQVIVNGFGGSLKKRSNRFIVQTGTDLHEFSAMDVEQIVLNDSASITTGAMRLAAESDTDIVIVSGAGEPVCRVYPAVFGKNAKIRKNQVLSSQNSSGMSLVSLIIAAKITNTGRLLEAIGRNRGKADIMEAGKDIIATGRKMVTDTGVHTPESLRGIEGDVSKRYFASLRSVLPDTVYSGFRSKHPAQDLFNAYLNYCYGILYNEVERACLMHGLDPYIGLLHSERYGKKPFVYDVIEQFRQPVVDRAVITLAVRGQMRGGDCDNKYLLTADGKRKAAGYILNRLDEERTISGTKTTFRNAIFSTARNIAQYFAGDADFVPFLYSWS